MDSAPKAATKYVLILDDNEPLAGMLVSLLNEELPDHRFLPARTVEEAQLLASEFEMDLFILDINLPDGTGLDFLCDVRTIAPDARALMMTAMPLPAYQRKAESLGVIHFLKKPFDFTNFVELVKALLDPHMPGPADSFFGTLRDLHLTDIIQIKCLSGVTAVVEFTSPSGEKGTIHFEGGQITHAHAPEQEGVTAFQTIVGWRGGSFAELTAVGHTPQTIFQDWQVLLIEAVRRSDEQAALAHGTN
jgi:DNA-binding response OmpR family regulator